MFEIGWTEILFIGLVAVLVLKPKDYPEIMRSIGQFLTKARAMAGEFQGQFNEAMKDAKLDDVRRTIDEIRDLRNMGPIQQVKDTFVQMADEAGKVKNEIQGVTTGSGVPGALDSASPPPPAVESAPLPAEAAQPPADLLPPPPTAQAEPPPPAAKAG
jgi:sec-independent protein translocase protein TatB